MFKKLICKIIFKINDLEFLHECLWYGLLSNNFKWNDILQWAIRNSGLEYVEYK